MTLPNRPATPAAAAVLVAFLVMLGALPAWASSTLGPTQVEAGSVTTFTISVADAGSVDLVAQVRLEHDPAFNFAGCSAPGGWACSGGGGVVSWDRQSSLGPDGTFAVDLVAPLDAGDFSFTTTDRRTSGASDTSSATVTVTPAAEAEPEASEDPEPSEEPSEVEETPPSIDEPNRPDPPMEPFRPPDQDGPLTSIRDLPDDPAPDATASDDAVAAPSSAGGSRMLTTYVLAPLAGLLLLSLGGFFLAAANR